MEVDNVELILAVIIVIVAGIIGSIYDDKCNRFVKFKNKNLIYLLIKSFKKNE